MAMPPLHRFSRLLLPALTAAAFLSASGDAEATHFRYGHLTWQTFDKASNTVDFRLRTAFRRSNFPGSDPDGSLAVGDVFFETVGGAGFDFGDGNFIPLLEFEVVLVDKAKDTVDAVALDPNNGNQDIRHQYSGPGPWIANFTDCCRLSALSNNPDDAWKIETIVDLSVPGNTMSPSSSLPPLVSCPTHVPCMFVVSATDSDADTKLVWRFATPAEYGDNWAPMAGMTIDADTGVVTWDTTQQAGAIIGTLWSVQVVIEDRDALTNQLRTKVSVDFIIELALDESQNHPPVCSFSGGISGGQTLTTVAGIPLQFDVTVSDEDFADNVRLSAVGVPADATLNPPLPANGNPITTTFRWIAKPPDVGTTHTVTFTAVDEMGFTTTCSVDIEVKSECYVIIGLQKTNMQLNFTGDTLYVQPMVIAPVLTTWIPTYDVPNDVSLLGTHVYAQVIMWNFITGGVDPMRLSNGIDYEIGGSAVQFGHNQGMNAWPKFDALPGGKIALSFHF